MEYLERFRLEPRGRWGQTTDAILVIYDKQEGKYLEENGNKHHAYVRFENSDKAYEYLKAHYPDTAPAFKPMKHISDVRAALEACNSVDELCSIIATIPNGFGNFSIEDDTISEDGCTILNTWYDKEGDYQEDEFDIEFDGGAAK